MLTGTASIGFKPIKIIIIEFNFHGLTQKYTVHYNAITHSVKIE